MRRRALLQPLVYPSPNFVGAFKDTADLATYTFTSKSYGLGQNIIAVVADKSSGNIVCNSVEMKAGNFATRRSEYTATANSIIELWEWDEPSAGATEDIIIKLSATSRRCAIGLWQLGNAPWVSGSDVEDNSSRILTFSTNANAGDIALGCVTIVDSGYVGGDTIVAGYDTKDADENIEGVSNRVLLRNFNVSAGTPLVLTSDCGIVSPTGHLGVGALWRPV